MPAETKEVNLFFKDLDSDHKKALQQERRDSNKEWLLSVGRRLKCARVDVGISQQETTDILLCSINHASDIETGNADFKISELRTLCETYHCTPNDILGYGSLSSVDIDINSTISKLSPRQKERLLSYVKLLSEDLCYIPESES
ncbi:MAG: helix-turn-helix transcriptional regulator [Blautia sp.]|nr:helix-turn-helix transcriptional regulator [Blautia sp.]